jgi:hypothetical protein
MQDPILKTIDTVMEGTASAIDSVMEGTLDVLNSIFGGDSRDEEETGSNSGCKCDH